jgi:hypothetical protein
MLWRLLLLLLSLLCCFDRGVPHLHEFTQSERRREDLRTLTTSPLTHRPLTTTSPSYILPPPGRTNGVIFHLS